MTLAKPIVNEKGIVLCGKGLTLTETLISELINLKVKKKFKHFAEASEIASSLKTVQRIFMAVIILRIEEIMSEQLLKINSSALHVFPYPFLHLQRY